MVLRPPAFLDRADVGSSKRIIWIRERARAVSHVVLIPEDCLVVPVAFPATDFLGFLWQFSASGVRVRTIV